MRRNLIIGIFTTIVACIIYSCQSAQQLEQDRYYVNGRDIYIAHCQNCHGAKGEGLGELAPPLTDTVFLKENKKQLAGYIKYGLEGPITVGGIVYDEKMPAEDNMADIDIAQLIVYITNTFGNNQGMYTTEQVASDLKNFK
ncbi:c-type cytochrome [Pedobacter sp.]|uniref:c-type cytochrome n=1 Tax=Pedobacter sp. TaxID=1411316 RepID=UPI003D7F3CB7